MGQVIKFPDKMKVKPPPLYEFGLKPIRQPRPKFEARLSEYERIFGRILTKEEIREGLRMYKDMCYDLGIKP